MCPLGEPIIPPVPPEAEWYERPDPPSSGPEVVRARTNWEPRGRDTGARDPEAGVGAGLRRRAASAPG